MQLLLEAPGAGQLARLLLCVLCASRSLGWWVQDGRRALRAPWQRSVPAGAALPAGERAESRGKTRL